MQALVKLSLSEPINRCNCLYTLWLVKARGCNSSIKSPQQQLRIMKKLAMLIHFAWTVNLFCDIYSSLFVLLLRPLYKHPPALALLAPPLLAFPFLQIEMPKTELDTIQFLNSVDTSRLPAKCVRLHWDLNMGPKFYLPAFFKLL